MRKRFFQRNVFLKFLMVLLAIVASITSAKATVYYNIKIIPVCEEGASGVVFAYLSAEQNTYRYQFAINKNNKWKASLDTIFETNNFYLCAKGNNSHTVIGGWYWDENCTQLSNVRDYCNWHSTDGVGKTITAYSTREDAREHPLTFYVKFKKVPTPVVDWSEYGEEPTDGKKYYIYSPSMHRFLKTYSASTASVSDATVFTYTHKSTSSATNMIDEEGNTPTSYSYTVCNLSCQEGGVTKYVKCETYSSWPTSTQDIRLWPQGENLYVIAKSTENYTYYKLNNITKYSFQYMLHVDINGNNKYINSDQQQRGPGIYWIFIPESEVLSKCKVKSLDENGDVTITASPTAEGTAYVKFNVSAASTPSGFNCSKSGADASDWVLGTPTCGADSIMSVPVTYTAKSVHKKPASSITVTVTAKNNPTNTMSGTATANVDFEPRFALMVDELDWSRVGEEVVETFYSGQEVAASERNRLANKLVKNDTQTTGIAANNATWTATITGTNADQFKFVNGTDVKPREVSGLYSANLLDVIYAPTTTGNHTATLHIVTSYTDTDSHTETYERDITLKGVGSAASRITFAKAGNQMPTNAEEHNFGEITGTNSREITANLFISQISNPKMEWTGDSAGVFEFVNSSSVDLTNPPLNQTLTFRAHRKSPVTANTNHTATLTISGKGTANEDVSATITLTYVAVPLIPTTVTWNWETMKENRTTTTSPITTNSDGEWLLTKTTGDAVIYNSTAKTATVAYLHHQPDQKATFYLTIPQTDTYTAYEDSLETTISPLPSRIVVDSKAALDEHVVYTSWEKWEQSTYGARTLYVDNDNVDILIEGQNVLEFDFSWASGRNNPSWILKEIWDDNSEHSVWNAVLPVGHKKYNLSPRTVKFRVKGYGVLKDITYYELDTIYADYAQVALIRDEDEVSDFDITATFANKRQVTASLNATAAQYFTISSDGKGGPSSSIVFNGDDGLGLGSAQNKVITVALKNGVTADEAQQAAMGNTCVLTFSDDYTYNHEELSLPILIVSPSEITYEHSAYGTYVVTYNDNVPHTVSSEDYTKKITDTDPALYVVTLSDPTPTASGYVFQGWKIGEEIVSCQETFTSSISIAGKSVVKASFAQIKGQYFKVGDVYFDDLSKALRAAGNSTEDKVVTLTKDTTLGDGHTPITYTIPAEVTLLIPHKDEFCTLQTTPEIVNLAQKEVLSAYRTLTLTDGVTIDCYGNICVAAKILSASGGNKSAYTTGECGVINMANGGHIELNDGANLYCWGYIKGQDMDQGNNTQGTGTVTANAGSVVWENFELGDWRGGSASMDIYNNNVWEHRMLFPFQSYAIQNVEIPTSFNFGSTLRTFTSITTGFGNHATVFAMIGSNETMFNLKDEQSTVRTWYDPTTDLSCYELSGTAKLDALHVNVYVEMSSEDFILPISNSMHIILKDNLTLSNPLMQQAGSIIEIKPTATVNLVSELYMYDKDQWGKYIYDCYFRSFNNLTSHKDRGAENSKEGLDDAKLIVDGKLYVKDSVINAVQKSGRIYATAGGANIMGNDNGQIHFKNTLPNSTRLWAVDTISGLPYIKWVYNNVAAANLCNEDGSYTKSVGGTNYHNVHGRWFYEDKKDEQPDHTYDFYYLDNGNTGEEEFASAVYSHDKTGLEARMKWFNVVRTADNCTDVEDDLEKPFTSNWWIDTLATTTTYYNYTMLNDWYQFIQTQDDEHVYSGSNNTLYQKDGCAWTEAAVVDENCLYTFDEAGTPVKKALVNGAFIPLTANGYDPAYHKTDDATKYYICFQGCNWHPATPYTGESKAYTIHPEDEDLHYIWFNGDWMNVLRDEPFFYTEDEQTNVRTYYEYVNGDWIVATPYVSVSDAIDPEPNPRTFYMIKEAFNVASIKKNATITLLRDISNVSEVLTYTTQNTTCTLDLNGHILSGNIANLITVNAPGATFTITDNTGLKLGKISNAASKAVYVQKGTLVVANGTIESSAAYAIEGAATTAININGGYFAATSKCVNVLGSCTISGGHFTDNTNLATYAADHKYPFETTDLKYRWEVSAAWQITFKNGAEVLQNTLQKADETPVYSGNEPYNDNQKFTGWDPAIEAATADATYQAQFEAIGENKSRVTLNSNGGNEGLQYVFVTTGSAIGTLPEGTTKDGHTFAGWWTTANGGTQMTVETTISEDVIYFAHYNKNSYTLTWEANGGDLSGTYTSGTVAYGTAITAPTATKDGCEFLGWIPALSSTMPGANTTYTAQWTIPYTVKHRQQNLNDDGYTEITADRQISSAAAGSYVTPAVKTYDGFMSPTAQPVLITANAEDNVITYDYARRTYTITLNATTNEGECATASVNVKHGATAALPAATKAGRVFEGWFTKAVGGDQITNETLIQRNIGTLYAQFSEANMTVTAPTIVSDTREVTDLRITTTGKLTITGDVTVTNFILESNGSTASGQLLPVTGTLNITGHAYFDLKLNAKNHQWYAVAVPWQVDAQTGISVNGKTLELGKDFDIIYYDGARRATDGKQKCWSYVEDDVDKTLVPGRLYMIGLMSDAATVRFEKTTGALSTTNTSVAAHPSNTGDETDKGWNGVANPALFHAFVNPGVTEGQVYVPDEKRYETVTLNETKFVVGEGAFVQVNADKAITVTKDGAFAAPRRTRAQANVTYDVRIAPAEGTYTDRLFIKTTDSKEADTYTVGEDLAKVGVSSIVPQMFVNRYNERLCVNTAELTNETAEYPLGISVPANGEYSISIQDAEVSDQYSVYLTLNNEAIWNLSDAPYTLDLTKGTTNAYGLRISAKAPQVVTGVDEAVVDAKGETRKMLINNQVFIIRGNEVYTIDGQLVK